MTKKIEKFAYVMVLALATMMSAACGGSGNPLTGPDIPTTPTPTPSAEPSVRIVSVVPDSGSTLAYDCNGVTARVTVEYDLGTASYDGEIGIGATYSRNGSDELGGGFWNIDNTHGTKTYRLCLNDRSVAHTTFVVAKVINFTSSNTLGEVLDTDSVRHPFNFE